MLSLLSNFKHGQEMRESKDEILVGELIRAMARMGMPAIGFAATLDAQSIRFKPLRDPALYAVTIIVDRKTGGSAIQDALIGSKAVLTFQAEVKNYLADPDDLIKMYRTDLQNIFKMPILGDVRLDHQLNSVMATKKVVADIDQLLPKGNEAGVNKLIGFLQTHIGALREKLVPYKKA